MCGVVAIYSYGDSTVNRDELRAIRDHMTSRGPDGQGEWFSDDGRAGMGHRRLSIIDLNDRAAQPMLSSDRRFVISFNGEIYNYKALRRELESKDVVFRTQSDTEVLLHLYADRGEAMVESLRGMYAFALFDAYENKLLLARDPYGIKPLYFADDGREVRIASQVKALVASGVVSKERNPAGLAGFYLFGSVPEPYTLYESIRAVPAGSLINIDRHGVHAARSYFSISWVFSDSETHRVNSEDNEDSIRDALLDSVKHHLVSDVPVGAFLSAGIDSGALVGLMRDAGQSEIKTVTLSFDEFRNRHRDEGPHAQQVARYYETEHTNRIVAEQEFRDDLPLILDAMDQPSIDGINTWFAAKAARELGLKVAISGLGGDELFGGYPSFRDIPRWVKWIGPVKQIAINMAKLLRGSQAVKAKTSALLQYGHDMHGAYLVRRGLFMPWELPGLMGEDAAREGLHRLRPLEHIANAVTPLPTTGFGKIASLESALYMRNQLLRDADWAGMAHSLEIRVPLVDAFLLQRIAPWLLVSGVKRRKHVLAECPARPLPDEIVNRNKSGFETPVPLWLKTNSLLRSWRSQSILLKDNCHWSRRLAFGIMHPA